MIEAEMLRYSCKGTTIILQFLQQSWPSLHAAGMADYKPGSAIGSTEDNAWMRNQRSVLRKLPAILLDLNLLKTES